MNALEAASYELASAQAELAKGAQALQATNETLAALDSRIAEKETSLAIIKQRRIETGQELDSDAPTVALLSLDIAGLADLAASAREAHQAAQEAENDAQQRVWHCEKAYTRAVAGMQATALLERLHEMESKLMAGIAELHSLRKLETGSNFVHGQSLYRFSQRLERFQSQGVLLAA